MPKFALDVVMYVSQRGLLQGDLDFLIRSDVHVLFNVYICVLVV